jgi:hypothetical protein
MRSLSAPPGDPVSPGAGAAQALFMEARHRRRRRWLAGTAAVLVAAAVVAVSAVTWLPRALGQSADHSGGAGAAVAGRSSVAAGRAWITFRVVTAGVPEAYGTEDIRFSGGNRSSSFSTTRLARGPEPTQTESGTERIVDGQVYDLFRVHGRLQWFHSPDPSYINPKIIDPRRLLRALERYSRFQATGSQVIVIGGLQLTVLRATDPGRLTQRDLLPVMWTSGQHVGSLAVWVDRQQVVHRMAFTFRAPDVIAPAQPAAPSAPPRTFPPRRGTEVTTTTVTFSAVGELQHITAPPHALSSR